MMADFDVAIVGGGAAGLTSALYVGRGLRSCVVFSTGEHRNGTTPHSHSFFTRDGAAPQELIDIGREQLKPYGVVLVDARVTNVKKNDEGTPYKFVVETADKTYNARRVIFAQGVADELPAIPGAKELWGTLLHACPFCHGFEVRGQELFYLHTDPFFAMLFCSKVSNFGKLTVLTNGPSPLPEEQVAAIHKAGVTINEQRIAKFERTGDNVTVHFENGDTKVFAYGYLVPKMSIRDAHLLDNLGCKRAEQGGYAVAPTQESSVSGAYLVGDLCTLKFPPAQLATATYTGMLAGAVATASIMEEDFKAGNPKGGK